MDVLLDDVLYQSSDEVDQKQQMYVEKNVFLIIKPVPEIMNEQNDQQRAERRRKSKLQCQVV